MYRRFDQLSQVLHEMQDRYGPIDPLVTQLQDAVQHSAGGDPKFARATLPFGERRLDSRTSSYWNVKLRNGPHAVARKDVLVGCTRVMHRVLGY